MYAMPKNAALPVIKANGRLPITAKSRVGLRLCGMRVIARLHSLQNLSWPYSLSCPLCR